MISQKDIDYMNECTTRDVMQLLVDEKQLSLNEAMNLFYNLKTFRLLMNPETGFYYQSSIYVFDVFGKIG